MATTEARSTFYKDAKFWGGILAVLGTMVAAVQTGESTWSGAAMGAVGGAIAFVLGWFTKSPTAPDAKIEPPSSVVAVPGTPTPPSDLPPPFVPPSM